MVAISLLSIAVLVVLIFPKRSVASIGDRLRATTRGDRTYAFGPPPPLGPSFAWSALAEALKMLEVGVPIYVACLWVEARGRRARLTKPAFTRPSLPPAPKARPPARRIYRMPPIEWTREWEASLLSRHADASTPPVAAASSFAQQPVEPTMIAERRLTIRSLGTLQLLWQGEDITAKLLRAPTLSFIWLFLLTHLAAHPGAKVHRQVLAEEAFPGIDSDQQRARLRGRLSDFQDEPFPPVLAKRVKIDGDLVWLDIETDGFDVARLREAVTDLGSGTGLLTDAGVRTIQARIADYGGEYLPLWEEVERETTGGRGAAADLVRAVRALADDFHIQLLMRLARHYQARRDDGQAIPLLEEVLRRRPDREDVAQLLIAGYRETGQMTRAGQLEATYRPEFVATESRAEIE